VRPGPAGHRCHQLDIGSSHAGPAGRVKEKDHRPVLRLEDTPKFLAIRNRAADDQRGRETGVGQPVGNSPERISFNAPTLAKPKAQIKNIFHSYSWTITGVTSCVAQVTSVAHFTKIGFSALPCARRASRTRLIGVKLRDVVAEDGADRRESAVHAARQGSTFQPSGEGHPR